MTDQLPTYTVDTVDTSSPDRGGLALPWILLILVLVPVLACGVLTVMTLGGLNRAVGIVQEVLDGGELVVRTDRTPAIITQVQELGRLETASYTVEKVIEGGLDQGNDVLNFFLGDRLLLIAHGEVLAGVDLTQVSQEDINISAGGSKLRLSLPPAMILAHRLDNEKSYVYDRQRGLLTKGDPDLESEVRRAAEQEILRAACEGGILAQATDNAQRQLTILMSSVGFEEVEVIQREGATTASCP
jgi:hypothetical protein